MNIEEYLEDTKRHMSQEEVNTYGFDFSYEEILENKDYFQECLDKEMSSYTALLNFPDYLTNMKPSWENYKNTVDFSSNPYDRKFELIEENDDFSNFKILGNYSFHEFFKMLEIDNDFKSRWGIDKIYIDDYNDYISVL
jgi:hypothetical protein